TRKAFEDLEPFKWRAIYDANVTSAVNVLQAAIPAMKRRRKGRIVTISSGAALRPSLTGIQSYASAKHALLGLTRQLAHDLGPYGITVNSVAPGFLRTSPDYERQWQSYGEAGQKAMIERIAMRLLGDGRHPLDDLLARARRREKAVPRISLVVLQSHLGRGRNVGKRGRTLVCGDEQRSHLAGAIHRRHETRNIAVEVDIARDQR